MIIHKFDEYSKYNIMSEYLIANINNVIHEDNNFDYKSLINKIISDLKLNSKLILTFGTGIDAFYPIISELISNMNIESIDITPDRIILLTICAITIIYIEEKKYINEQECDELTKDSKSMLEELKLQGIGNGIVKKAIKAIKSIGNVFNIIYKHSGAVIGGIIDMFSYTAMFVPILNGIYAVIHKYSLNLDTIVQNFMGLSIGVGTLISKRVILELINKLKKDSNISDDVVSEIDIPVISKMTNYENDHPHHH